MKDEHPQQTTPLINKAFPCRLAGFGCLPRTNPTIISLLINRRYQTKPKATRDRPKRRSKQFNYTAETKEYNNMCNDIGEGSRCCAAYSIVGAIFTVSFFWSWFVIGWFFPLFSFR